MLRWLQSVRGIFAPAFVFLLFLSSLEAFSFKDIVFEPAKANFIVEKKEQESSSNFVKINAKVDSTKKIVKPTQPTLAFYRYDLNSDDYLMINETDYAPNDEVSGEFNPMTPLLLEDGTVLDISHKIPALKCQIFKRNEPLIIVYREPNLSDNDSIKLTISTDKDKERIKLCRSEKNSPLFVGYINTNTRDLQKCDGKLFVEKGTEIKAVIYKDGKKSRFDDDKIVAIAGIEHVVFETKAESKEKEAEAWVSVESSKIKASIGEYIKYSVTIQNRGDRDIRDAVLVSKLSKGLKYQDASLKRKIPLIGAGEEKSLEFIASIDIDAIKYVQNSIQLLYHGKKSNISHSIVIVEDDFNNKSSIIGRVKLKDDTNSSLAGIKIYLETGRFSLTDRYGKFHFDNIKPSTHVVSIDDDSLSGRFTLTECKANARSMGSFSSQFIDTRQAHIKRVNFCIKKHKLMKGMKSSLSFKAPDEGSESMPEYTRATFKKYDKKSTFIWPKEGYVPPMPSIKVAFLHPSNQKIKLFINGKKVDMLNYDGFIKSKDGKQTISKYRGIDIVDGDNILEAHLSNGKVIKRVVHLSTAPVKAKLLKDKSTLIADGKTPAVIAVQLFDSAGYHLREGMVGTFSVEKPYISQEKLDALSENPLAVSSGKDSYVVSANGIAYIPIQATTRSGEVKLHFDFQNSNQYIKAWLSPKAREWFIVGFAQGDVGYQKIKDALKQTDTKEVVTNSKLSFFAKGSVGADTLLTIAYDSGKDVDLGVMEELESMQEFTVYGDGSVEKNEATSSKKLYLKIEKRAFYALFGDFDTALDTHELSKYSRRLNGIKSEFVGEVFEYSAFASQSKTAYIREEIQGDGTSGLYRLKNRDIVVGSEKVTIEVRDRYRDEIVLQKRVLSALYDYSMDYFDGTLYFKEPILKRDRAGNPQFIVVEYESKSSDKKSNTYGGRGAVKLFDGTFEIGATVLAQEHIDKRDTLYGFDAKIKATKSITIDAEYAQSKKVDSNNSNAYLLEVAHHSPYTQTKLYYKNQEDSFGFSQQNYGQRGMTKYGIDTTINYFKHVAIKLSAYGDKSHKNGDTKQVAEALVSYQTASFLSSLGYRYAKEKDQDAHAQLLSAISKSFFHNKLKLSAAYDFSLDKKSDTFENRTFAEASYFINQYVEIFANHEILEGETKKSERSQAGIKSRPWRGASIDSGIIEEFKNDSPSLLASMGMYQSYQVNKDLMLSASMEREQTLEGERNSSDDFTAYSVGVNYKKGKWVYSAKGEFRTSLDEDRTNVDLGIYTEVNKDLGVALKTAFRDTKAKQNRNQEADIKLSFAYRPEDSFLVMNKLEYLYSKDEIAEVSKVIETLLLDINPTKKTTLSAHYGLKLTEDWIDEKSFSSVIDTVGISFIYDLSRRLELGLEGSMLHSYVTNSFDESFGGYIGYNLFKNGWLGVGYNFRGFKDDDFASLRRSNQGAYLRFRLKFDQESLKDTLELF